jgi:glycosyltransferase involved in cell wall biosynthesis
MKEGGGMTAASTAPIRVLQIIAGLDPIAGGPPTSAVATSLALRRHGLVASFAYVVVPGREQAAVANANLLRSAGVRVYGFPVTRLTGDRGARWGISLRLAGWLARNARRFDVIHVHAGWTFTTVVGLAAARLGRRIAVLSAHESLTDFDRRKSEPLVRLGKRLLRYAYLRLFDVVVTGSALERRDSSDMGDGRTAIVPHAVRSVAAIPTEREGGTLHVGFLGRLHPKKNLERAIEAVADAGPDVRLVVAGDGSATYADYLRRLARDVGIGDRVTWLGFVDEERKCSFFGSIDLLVMPSHYESFGIAAVEALTAGVPIIVSPTVGVAEVIARREAGLVVPPTRQRLAEAIMKLRDDRALLASTAENAFAAADEFSLERHGAAMQREYRRLLGQSDMRLVARNGKGPRGGLRNRRRSRLTRAHDPLKVVGQGNE